MISVFIDSRGNAKRLAQTLIPLVGAAVEGIVRDVVVVHQRTDPECEAIADETGSSYCSADALEKAVRDARGEWCLLLEEGAVPGEGWTDAVRAFVAASRGRGRFKSRERGSGLRSFFGLRGALADGLLLPMHEAVTMAKRARRLEDLPQGRAARTIGASLQRPH